jgi:hypothetical protein
LAYYLLRWYKWLEVQLTKNNLLLNLIMGI